MKRSEINQAIASGLVFLKKMNYALPPFATWTASEWRNKGPECRDIIRQQLGWIVTDFGSGDFERVGRTIFTLRNGSKKARGRSKVYAQKVMMLEEGQKSPVHFHVGKMEDIINQGGGNILISLWNAGPENTLLDTPVTVSVDGRELRASPGQPLRLGPGESVCLPPRTYHQFWAEPGCGTTVSVEVSSVCDDFADNFFLEQMNRFPPIEEDEPARHCLCNEYPPAPEA